MNVKTTRSGLWSVIVEIEGIGVFELKEPSLKEAVLLQQVLETGDRAEWTAEVISTLLVRGPEIPGSPELPSPEAHEDRLKAILLWPYAVAGPLMLATAEMDCPWSQFMRQIRDGVPIGKGAGDNTSSPPSPSGS